MVRVGCNGGSCPGQEFWRGRYRDLFILSLTPASFDDRFAAQLDRRRSAAPPERRIDDFVAVVHELWPLDSLGAAETLLALARQSVERDLQHGDPLRTPADRALTERALTD